MPKEIDTAIIVAAGMGKRMKHHTSDKPKILLEVGGVTLLERLTNNLQKSGITDINLVVGYKRELFQGLNKYKVFVNDDYENNNILNSLFYAEDAMHSGFFFSYSDIVYDENIVKQMRSDNSDILSR
jgi:choline kinase